MAKSQIVPVPTTDSSSAKQIPAQEAIAIRAHEIFLERGATPGHDLDDWLQAELEISMKRADGGSTRITSNSSSKS